MRIASSMSNIFDIETRAHMTSRASTLFLAASLASAQSAQPPAPARVANTFEFVLPIPLAQAAPFFGPEGERCWAGANWNPQFVWPQPAHDTEGMVFTLAHGGHNSTWVNTVFDLTRGRMQYVVVIPSHMVSVIDVRLTAPITSQTHVQVTYTRTALDPAANDAVHAAGEADKNQGPQWKHDIETCLAGQQASPTPSH